MIVIDAPFRLGQLHYLWHSLLFTPVCEWNWVVIMCLSPGLLSEYTQFTRVWRYMDRSTLYSTIIIKVHSWCKHSIMQWHADLDECEFQLHSCDINAECENTIGSYECHCRSGYRGNGRICNGNGVHAHTDPNNDSYHCFYNSIFHSCFVYL